MSIFFFSSRRRHTRFDCDWSSDVCSSDLCTVVTAMSLERYTRLLMDASAEFPIHFLNIYSSSGRRREDRKSTRLNSSHSQISYAVFCLKKKKIKYITNTRQKL